MIETIHPIFNKEIDRLRLDISEVCYSKLDSTWQYRDRKPLFTRIYGITQGEGIIYTGGRQIPMTQGNIYILPTGIDLHYKCSTYLEKIYFHVNLLRYNNSDMFSTMLCPAVIPNRVEEIAQAVYLFNRNDMYSVMRLKAWLWEMVSLGLEISGTEFTPIPKYSPLVEQAVDYINHHLRSGLSVKEIANDLYISESRLQKTFRDEMKIPLGKYISDRLFFIAEQKLRTTDLAIKDISTELGYCDPFYFTRCFTQKYGVSPSEYRKNMMRN